MTQVGFGYRSTYRTALLREQRRPEWLELLADNHFFGETFDEAAEISTQYRVTLHCVGMNLGGTSPLNRPYFDELRRLADATNPAVISDHLAFTSVQARHHHDLWPMPRTDEALEHVSNRVIEIQNILGRQIAVENISTYVRHDEDAMPEGEFLARLVDRAGCRLILDLNNLWVNAFNHGEDPHEVLGAVNSKDVAYIHIAGAEVFEDVIIDTHDRKPSQAVWDLLQDWRDETDVLIEWDDQLPTYDELMDVVDTAAEVVAQRKAA